MYDEKLFQVLTLPPPFKVTPLMLSKTKICFLGEKTKDQNKCRAKQNEAECRYSICKFFSRDVSAHY